MAHTSALEFISSLHGRQRRRERDLDRRDLEIAITDGSRELQHRRGKEPRWKITWGDVVYITDLKMSCEITSFSLPLPLQRAPLSDGYLRQVQEMRRRLRSGEQAASSHTVLVVDQSGSMMESDVAGHRTRSRCVFYNLAMEVVAAPIMAGIPSFTDVVTVIQMREDAEVIVDAEPMTWCLFNQLVDLAAQADRDAETKKRSARHGGGASSCRAHGHGHFLPALQLAALVMRRTVEKYGTNVALLLFFLSDGRPSDHLNLRVSEPERDAVILREVGAVFRGLPAAVRPKVIFGAFGFASRDSHDFELLRDAATLAGQFGAHAVFQHGVDARALRAALLQMSSLLTLTVSKLSSLVHGGGGGGGAAAAGRTDLVRAAAKDEGGPRDFSDWRVFQPAKRFALKRKDTPAHKVVHKYFVEVPMLCHADGATGFAKSTKYFGEGAERVAFEFRELNKRNNVLGPPLVWKENKHFDHVQLQWHALFAATQLRASRLARKFCGELDRVGVSRDVARIQFIEPSFYVHTRRDGSVVDGLCEEHLPSFTKWTDNRGGVKFMAATADAGANTAAAHHGGGKIAAGADQGAAAAVDATAHALAALMLDDKADADTGSGRAAAARPGGLFAAAPAALHARVIDEDVLLAFSHWTYVYTQRESLVCDLQGTRVVLANGRPLFKLTDPCIHSKAKGKFGMTDRGRDGCRDFIRTHRCNALCQLLKLRHLGPPAEGGGAP